MSDDLRFETLDESKDLRVQPKGKGPWLSKSIACFIVGIASLAIGPLQYGFPGVICGFICISYYLHDVKIYRTDPEAYAKSYKYLRRGLILGIFGIVVSFIMCFVWYWAIFRTCCGSQASPPNIRILIFSNNWG